MDICIIADDLTGANDSGVQLTRSGYRPSVILQVAAVREMEKERSAMVVDTDSRALQSKKAYEQVKEASRLVLDQSPNVVYKKMDSTLRGNIGKELDAIYDVFQPDFIVMTPAYPENGRVVQGGELYIKGKKLTDAGFSTQPGHEFSSSNVVDIVHEQSVYRAVHLTTEQIQKDHLVEEMKNMQKQGITHISIEASDNQELEQNVKTLAASGFRIVWGGSAGVARYLPEIYGLQGDAALEEKKSGVPVQKALFVAGSRSDVTRRQLEHLKKNNSIHEIEIDPVTLLQGNMNPRDLVSNLMLHDFTVMYTNTEPEKIKEVKEAAAAEDMTVSQATRIISSQLGKLVKVMNDRHEYDALILTGGDIAKAICSELNSSEFELCKEFETGIPLGRLRGRYEPLTITKAGAFGQEETFTNILHYLKGEVLL